MSRETQSKRRKNREFWRAVAFLHPYRKLIIISMLCAVVTGGLMTASIGAMYPLLQVLIKGDTIQGWVQRHNVERRLGIDLLQANDRLAVTRVEPKGPAADAGIKPLDEIEFSSGSPNDPALSTINISVKPDGNGTQTVQRKVSLNPMSWYGPPLLNVAMRLPEKPVPTIIVLFLGIAGIGLIGNVFRFFQEFLSDKSAIGSVNDVRKRLYDHVLHIPLAFFGMKGTSDVTSRLVQDAKGLQDGFEQVLGQSIQEPIKEKLRQARTGRVFHEEKVVAYYRALP